MTKLSASSQDYLEAVLQLSRENEQIRSVDIATRLGVTRASVNRAMKVLKEAGYVDQERYSDIILTEAGRLAGQEIHDRHVALNFFLHEVLGVSPATAEDDACKMEHSLSEESLVKLRLFLDRYRQRHNMGSEI